MAIILPFISDNVDNRKCSSSLCSVFCTLIELVLLHKHISMQGVDKRLS